MWGLSYIGNSLEKLSRIFPIGTHRVPLIIDRLSNFEDSKNIAYS